MSAPLPPATPTALRMVDTPLGPLALVATEAALTGAYFDDHRNRPDLDHLPRPAVHPVLDQAEGEFAAYFSARPASPATQATFAVPTLAQGTEFEREVWAALLTIGYGQTRTYAQVATGIGRPTATRAIAAAIGRNRLTLAVPCHRVVGANGALTGYAGGLERKQWLLDHEATATV